MGDIFLKEYNHACELCGELRIMWKKDMVDYTIKGHYRQFHIHAVVFAAMSPTFKAMLSSQKVEAAEREVTFPTISDGVMAAVIDYLYTGECTMQTNKLLEELLDAAKYLQIKCLHTEIKKLPQLCSLTQTNEATTIADLGYVYCLFGELSYMFARSQLLDYSITGQERVFRIHSVVLAAMSPTFNAMLRSDMGQPQMEGSTFPTIPDDVLDKVLYFAYNGTCIIENEQLTRLYEAARILNMTNLRQLCKYRASVGSGDLIGHNINHHSYLCDQLEAMRRNEEFCDYSIRGDKRTFRIHTIVLAAMSPTFKQMLHSDKGESAKTQRTFPDISDNLIDLIIQFSYTGSCTIKSEQLTGLTDAAHYLKMHRLLKLCQQNADNGDITLQDTSHHFHLCEELGTIWRENELLDYTITGQDRTFRVSSVLFCATSHEFKVMLRSGLKEATDKEASFPTIPDDMLSAVIEFISTGRFTIQGDQLMELIEAAHFLQMDKLLQLCQHKLTAVLRPSNCLEWSCFARKYDLFVLKVVDEMILTNFSDIIRTASFTELTKSDIIQYLQKACEHGIDIFYLVLGMINWLNHDWQKRLPDTHDVLMCFSRPTTLREILLEVSEKMELKICVGYVLSVLSSMPEEDDDEMHILVCGGERATGEVNTTCWELKSEVMHQLEIIPDEEVVRFHSLCSVPRGIIMTGGEDSSVCLLFLRDEKKWIKCPDMLVPRSHHGSGLSKGNLFVIAGYEGKSKSLSVHFLDMAKNEWRKGPDVPGFCILPQVISIHNNLYVLFTETCDWYMLDETYDLNEFYDMKPMIIFNDCTPVGDGVEMDWSERHSLPMESSGCSLAASEDCIFAAGGSNHITYMYDIESDIWCELSGPSITELNGSLVCHAEKLYLFPGFSMLYPDLVDIKEYDIKTNSWSLSKWKMPKPLRLFGVFVINMRR